MVWEAWGPWEVWAQAWGVWVQGMVAKVGMVASPILASKRRQGRALEVAWVGATANKPKEALEAREGGTVSKEVGATGDKQVAEVPAAATHATDLIDAAVSGQTLFPLMVTGGVLSSCMSGS